MPLSLATWVTGDRSFWLASSPNLPGRRPSALLDGGDLHRHVVGVAIDRHAALEDRERQPLGLQIAVVGADQRRQLRPPSAPSRRTCRVAAVLPGVIVDPADRLGDVAGHLLDAGLRQEAVVGRDEDEALLHERLRLHLHVGLVARLPAAAVNPEDDRVVLALPGGEDIERLALVLRLGVGDVTMNLWLVSESRGGEEQNPKNGLASE